MSKWENTLSNWKEHEATPKKIFYALIKVLMIYLFAFVVVRYKYDQKMANDYKAQCEEFIIENCYCDGYNFNDALEYKENGSLNPLNRPRINLSTGEWS